MATLPSCPVPIGLGDTDSVMLSNGFKDSFSADVVFLHITGQSILLVALLLPSIEHTRVRYATSSFARRYISGTIFGLREMATNRGVET